MIAFAVSLALILPLDWRVVTLPNDASLRGVAIASDSVIAVAGSGPQVWVSADAGISWQERTPHRDGVTDYRCVAMPTENVLLVASAGSPAVIARSEDYGRSWSTVHLDERPAAFIDAMRFWDANRGVAFGDPVGGEFLLLATDDAGQTWRDLNCPVKPLEGEAGFAASNGSISLAGDSFIAIGLGGRADGGSSRVLVSHDAGQTWTSHEIAEMPASPTSGIFSIVIRESGFGIAVGGDYMLTDQTAGNIAVTEDHGKTWRLPTGKRPGGFRSSIMFLPSKSPQNPDSQNPDSQRGDYWLAAGPTGTDISDDGEDWRPLSEKGFHALSLLPNGTPIATGSDGRFAIMNSVD